MSGLLGMRGIRTAIRVSGAGAFPWRPALEFPRLSAIRAFVLPSPSWIARRHRQRGLPCHAEQALGPNHEIFALRSPRGS